MGRSTGLGRIGNLFAPGEMTNIDQKKVKAVTPSPISMMPPGLLNTLSDTDIFDLIAYVLSGGDLDQSRNAVPS